MDEEEVLFEAKRKRRRSTPFPYEYDGQNYFCFGSDLEALFFERKDEAVVRCKVEGCPYPLYKQRFGRGYSNVKSHLITHHRDRWQKDIFDALRPNQFDEENGEGALTIASSATKKGAASTIPSSPKTPAPSSSKTTAKGKNGDQKTPKTTLKSTPVTSSWASSTLPLTTSTAVAATSANNTTTTTTTTTTKPLLSESFKKKLYRRKIGNEHECELCSQIIGDLEIIQLIDIKYKQQYEKDFPFNRQLPASLYDANNGLLLCCNCYFKYNSYIEEEGGGSASSGGGRCIQIDCTGTIHLYGFAKKINYLKLDGKKVPWADLIDHDHHYPSSATLEYALNLQTSKKNKRSRDEAMMDTTDEEKEKGVKTIDQRSIESIEDDDSEEDESN